MRDPERAVLTTAAEPHVRWFMPDSLGLIVMPTEQCNFRCRYCFEGFEAGRMSDRVVDRLERFLARRANGLRALYLQWYGGEPLLAADIVERVQRFALRLQSAPDGPRVTGGITTNGYHLAGDVHRALLDAGIRDYQVTLDGPREHHDASRVRAGGQPTFERIWRNLLGCREVTDRFRLILRLHVDVDNLAGYPRFLETVAGAFGGDDRFALFIRAVSRLGGRGDGCAEILPDTAARDAVAALRLRATEIGLEPIDEDGFGKACYAAMPNQFVVRSDGRLGKCTVALDHDANTVGRLADDGRVELDATAIRPWIRGVFSGVPSELNCPASGWIRDPG